MTVRMSLPLWMPAAMTASGSAVTTAGRLNADTGGDGGYSAAWPWWLRQVSESALMMMPLWLCCSIGILDCGLCRPVRR